MSSSHNILGVPINASKSEIKRAYYRKARLLHPDVNKSPNAEEEFIRLNMAYEALTNPKFKIIKITPSNNQTSPQKSTAELRREQVLKRREELRKEALKRASIRKEKRFLYEIKENIKFKYFKLFFTIFIQILIFIPISIRFLSLIINYESNVDEKELGSVNSIIVFFVISCFINLIFLMYYFKLFSKIKKSKKSLHQSQG